MKQNKYDEDAFFQNYSKMERSVRGWMRLVNGMSRKPYYLI